MRATEIAAGNDAWENGRSIVIPKGRRIALIDLGRGVALIAMTVYHLCWDLAMFGVIRPDIMAEPALIWFARSIAGSFLFLAGFSLFLAHGQGIQWAKFARRLGVIVAAAALITIATWFATPEAFIFFGILHSIAAGSIIGLLFLRLPWWLIVAFGMFVLSARQWLADAFFDSPAWWWTGLSIEIPRSNDFVPIFPFFGMVLLGIAGAKLCTNRNWLARLRRIQPDDLSSRALRFIGRHSLIFYLAHQPVLIAFLAGLLWLSGSI